MKNRTLIVIAIIVVAITLLGNQASLYFSLQDTAGVEKGMTIAEYKALIPEEDRLDFGNYSFYPNNRDFPVLIRSEADKIVEIQVLDLSKISAKKESFEKITVGMTLTQVSQRVGVPGGIAKADDKTLAYNLRNEIMYLIRFTQTDGVFYVESITSESLE